MDCRHDDAAADSIAFDQVLLRKLITTNIQLIILLINDHLYYRDGEHPEKHASQVETNSSLQSQIFITHIFNKYGQNGVMYFEGFEHLLYSLGIGKDTAMHSNIWVFLYRTTLEFNMV